MKHPKTPEHLDRRKKLMKEDIEDLKYLREFARQKAITLYDAMTEASEIETLRSAGAKNISNFHRQLEEVRGKIGKFNAYQTTELIIDTFNLRRIYENSQQVEDAGARLIEYDVAL